MSPLGGGGRRGGQNPARFAGVSAGEGRGEGLGSLASGFWPEFESGRLRRQGATAARAGGHGSSGAGELTAGIGDWGARATLQGPRGVAGDVNWQWRRVGQRCTHRGAPGAVVSTGVAPGEPTAAFKW
jgi:hypothetical protein